MRFVLSQTSGSCVVLRYIDIGCMTLDNLLFEGTMKGSARVCLPWPQWRWRNVEIACLIHERCLFEVYGLARQHIAR